MSTLSAGLLLSAAGCVADATGNGGGKHDRPASDTQLRGTKTSLSRASSCDDLLKKIQDDAIAKLDLSVAVAKQRWQNQGQSDGDFSGEGGDDVGIADAPTRGPTLDSGAVTTNPIAPTPPQNAGLPVASFGGLAGGTGGGGGLSAGGTGQAAAPGTMNPAAPTGEEPEATAGSGNAGSDAKDPIGASGTNTQVKDVDEADFIKLVDSGRGMFLLHGSSLRKLKTYPPEQLSLEPPELKIEGNPSELFVTDEGRAVIFSSVYGYPNFGGANESNVGKPVPVDVICDFGRCGGGGYYGGGDITKITVADVSGDKLTAVRELYYQGSYISSRRYADIVRVVVQSERSYDNLYEPELDGYDPWGRPYAPEVIDEQLEQWRDRIATSVRSTKLSDWVPAAKELKNGSLVDLAPGCDTYFVPQPGFSDSGLVQVVSFDVSKTDAAVGGISVMGRASTVYSSSDRLILAQPDYRWLDDGSTGDFGFIDQQRTTLHAFALDAGKTSYLASGWVPGHLPLQNQQFGLDETEGHTLRIATTGQKRSYPDAKQNSPNFWATETENLVTTLQEDGTTLKVVGTSDPLGKMNESVQSARFVGDRAYVVTFRQTDPLIVLDMSDDKEPVVMGEIEIPGFAQYVHPLDDDHLITFGSSGNGGSQLQLFDVHDPLHIPAPKTLDFGGSSSSETAYNHKAFTYYAPLGLIALPVSAARQTSGFYSYVSALRVIHVDKDKGFELLGSIDHSAFADTSFGCISCGPWGCQAYCSAGSPEVRRGAFVENSDTSYVYAIGYGGVTVNDVKDLTTPLAKVKLPATVDSTGPWYAGGTQGASTPPSGGFFGGTSGGGSVGVGVVNPTTAVTPPAPSARPVAEPMPAARDAGAVLPAADGGVDTVEDAG
jgi:Beta propeller domain